MPVGCTIPLFEGHGGLSEGAGLAAGDRVAEARITRMKDGRKRLAPKLEQAVDIEIGAMVATTVQTMDGGDTASFGGDALAAARLRECRTRAAMSGRLGLRGPKNRLRSGGGSAGACGVSRPDDRYRKDGFVWTEE